MFAVGRSDLPPGLRTAQMCHALRGYASQYPYIESEWYLRSNTLVLLEVRGGAELDELAERANKLGITVTEFSESDDLGLTALALGPDAARLVSSLPLALRDHPRGHSR
jgi:hypothetical protein